MPVGMKKKAVDVTFCTSCGPHCKGPPLEKVSEACRHPFLQGPAPSIQIPVCMDCSQFLQSGGLPFSMVVVVVVVIGGREGGRVGGRCRGGSDSGSGAHACTGDWTMAGNKEELCRW